MELGKRLAWSKKNNNFAERVNWRRYKSASVFINHKTVKHFRFHICLTGKKIFYTSLGTHYFSIHLIFVGRFLFIDLKSQKWRFSWGKMRRSSNLKSCLISWVARWTSERTSLKFKIRIRRRNWTDRFGTFFVKAARVHVCMVVLFEHVLEENAVIGVLIKVMVAQ